MSSQAAAATGSGSSSASCRLRRLRIQSAQPGVVLSLIQTGDTVVMLCKRPSLRTGVGRPAISIRPVTAARTMGTRHLVEPFACRLRNGIPSTGEHHFKHLTAVALAISGD
jgi:hypothetical protein